jgi:hypothetical protein
MEDLTKQQMVLLTVLVSFVCSVATSIMIVSLLTDTAPVVTQTINNIVEKTIEKVVTGTTTPIYIKTPSVPVMTEGEKVLSALQINLPKMVSIREKALVGESATSTVKIGVGTMVSPDGLILVDSSVIGEKTEFIVFFGDKYRTAKKVYFDNTLHLAFLQTGDAIKDDKNTEGIVFFPVVYSRTDLSLGLPMVALGGENGKSMARGTLTEIPDKKTSSLVSGDMTITASYKGGIVFGLDGKVIGFVLSNPTGIPEIKQSSNIVSVINDYKALKTESVKP